MRGVIITRFGQMHFVAGPKGLSLLRKKSFRIIRRVDQDSRCRSIGEIAPMQFSFLPIKVLHPDASQRLDGRDLPQPKGRSVGVKSIKQLRPIFPDDNGIGFTRLFALWETIVFHPVLIALDPLFSPLLFEPLWSDPRQTIQDRSKGFSNSFYAVE